MGNLFLNEISETILRVTETPWMMSTGEKTSGVKQQRYGRPMASPGNDR